MSRHILLPDYDTYDTQQVAPQVLPTSESTFSKKLDWWMRWIFLYNCTSENVSETFFVIVLQGLLLVKEDSSRLKDSPCHYHRAGCEGILSTLIR
jgi:hypothetical protein